MIFKKMNRKNLLQRKTRKKSDEEVVIHKNTTKFQLGKTPIITMSEPTLNILETENEK